VKNRKALLVGVAALFVFAVAWMFLLYRPAGSDLSDARDDLRAAQDELSGLDLQLGRLRATEADLPRLQSGIETLRAAVPDDPGLADFILAVNEAALAAGLEVQAIVPDQPRVTGALSEVNVGLNTEGGYYKVLDFLNRLAAMQRVITIENLSLSALRGDNPAQEPLLQVTMQTRIYSRPGTPTQPAADTPTPEGSGDESEQGSTQ
jgi:Tfp pilus assembly protein PilO